MWKCRLFLSSFTFFLFSCVPCSLGQVPLFDEIQAFEYLKKQCAFGPRDPGSRGHKACLQFLKNELKKRTNSVVEQPFHLQNVKSSKHFTGTNVIASFGLQSDRILLCAHWDTRPWAENDSDAKNWNRPVPGANDGASGVAVLLEIARILELHPPSVGVEIVFFDGEDSGISGSQELWCQGSSAYAKAMKSGNPPRFAILLDMIGDRDLYLPVEGFSRLYAPEVVDRVWKKAAELGLSDFDFSTGPSMTDDHLELLNVGIPAIDIIDFDYPYWHTTQDTEDKCSPQSLAVIGTLLLYMIYE